MNPSTTAKNGDNFTKAQAMLQGESLRLLETMPKPEPKAERRVNLGGRPKGSFSRRENPLKRELHREGLAVIKATITAAKAGDVSAQRLIFDRLLPRERTIKLKLPRVRTTSDALTVLATLLDLAGDGTLTTQEASNLSALARSFVEVSMAQELAARVDVLEARLAETQ